SIGLTAVLAAWSTVQPPQAAPQQADGAVAAVSAVTQNPLQRKARLSVRSLELGEALAALQNQSGASLFYSPRQLPIRKVTCQGFDRTVAEAPDRIVEESRLPYSILGGHVLIEPEGVRVDRLRDVSSDLAGAGFVVAARG